MKHPDPALHLRISLIKSVFRIAAGIALMLFSSLVIGGALIIIAESLGIIEELV